MGYNCAAVMDNLARQERNLLAQLERAFQNCKDRLRNVVKYGKYSFAKFVYTCIIGAKAKHACPRQFRLKCGRAVQITCDHRNFTRDHMNFTSHQISITCGHINFTCDHVNFTRELNMWQHKFHM